MCSKRRKKFKKLRFGFALPLVASLVIILVLMGASMLSLGQHARIRSIRATNDIGARAAADAGLVKAVFLMNNKAADEDTWNNKELPSMEEELSLPSSNETYNFDIDGNPAKGFTITSTGFSGLAERKVFATTRMLSIFDYAIAVKKNLVLYPNTEVNGYNSTTGETDLPVQIGTNSVGDDSAIVMNDTYVNGDVFVGPGGDPAEVIKSRGEITGGTYQLGQEIYFPPVSPLEGLADKGSIDLESTSITIQPKDSGIYSSIYTRLMTLTNKQIKDGMIAPPANIVIDGGDVVMHVTGDIDLGNSSEMIIMPGSTLTMYVDGDWVTRNDAGINNMDGIPSNFTVYGTGDLGQHLEMKAKNEFFGRVYAPDAYVDIKAGGDIYGSFTAHDFDMKSKSVLKYDTELSKKDIDDIGIYFTVSSWREE
ncbi:MAG: DUF7305 domain-containing protein [Planctomycetota bacterium]|jgi:hypothetical protein